MKLSIVTINYNDARGLAKTLKSVASQIVDCRLKIEDFQLEHNIVDGGSTDGSVDVIKEYVRRIEEIGLRTEENGSQIGVKWVSEKDNGVYNAMNKGIRMATGDYIQILNSGDILASDDVLAKVRGKMEEVRTADGTYPELIYGNMLVDGGEGSFAGSHEIDYSLKQYYSSTMNHDCCWMKRSLFDEYGLYDEDLKIVSDWKWFLQAIGLGHVKPVYVDIDMTIFEGGGISSVQVDRRNAERRKVLEEVLPSAVLVDYDRFAFPMEQVKRLKKYHLWGLVYFVERVLFKLEKWHILK